MTLLTYISYFEYDQNVDGHTALMFAYNGKNQVEVLLDKYSEYMKEGSDNSTRIIREALQTHVEVVQLLMKGGADLAVKDSEGHVAVDFDYKAPVLELEIPAVPAIEGSITPDKEL
jgi:ankyrin repeat protein